MRIVKVTETPPMKNPHGVDARKLLDAAEAQVIHIELKPGEALVRHITPVDVFFYVLEGTGTVEIGDETARVGADTLVESPAGIPHRWVNDGDGPFRVLVAKTPRPVEPTVILDG